ncbi:MULTISPECIES: response regulator [Falsihalocynthiibacter]|uniref:response regulator n=1 Tax=Falsihalocynthiibacter TaxID=2854182 RepID=UPI003002F8D2
MDDLSKFMNSPPPTPTRPLLGVTVLVVEDSRYASEAMRMLCLRSGARIRRADCLRSARKHLQVFNPTVVIVDMGLPDGSGAELLAELSQTASPISVLLATSGDSGLEEEAIAAGAVGFLSKPVNNLAQFQNAILAHLPTEDHPPGPRLLNNEQIVIDKLALRDDFAHVEEVLAQNTDGDTLDYLAHFISGIAQTAQDGQLIEAANALAHDRAQGRSTRTDVERISSMLRARLEERTSI